MSKEMVLTSVGIDIGTTTTQLVISRLTLINVMPGSQVPRIEIGQKNIQYIGEVHITPFLDRKRVDGEAVKAIIAGEYAKAGISPAEIDTGAVIITGETAKKENASVIIHHLAEYAGDFVVATAGPDLESVIAGRGSGAEELSKKLHLCLANIDIGGGTTNIAYFDKGRCIGTACLNVGGRLFEVDPATHAITYVEAPAASLLTKLNCLWADDPSVSYREIENCLEVMVGAVEKVLRHRPLSEAEGVLGMTNSLPEKRLDGIVFSGGVAKYIYEPDNGEWWVHGDTGPLLARAFLENAYFAGCKVYQGNETIHSTVLGAGAHTIDISGSTVTVSRECLPLRNIPAVYPEKDEQGGVGWQIPAARFKDSVHQTLALIVPPLPDLSFNAIYALAEKLALELELVSSSPKVVIAQQDIAKVLGQTLLSLLGPVPLICLDGIELYLGDYLDIAKPLPYGDAVPVIVKTLVFLR